MKRQRPASLLKKGLLSTPTEPAGFFQEFVTTARAGLDRRLESAADYARMEPEKALASALAAGYVLRMLPLNGILRVMLRLGLALLKPAALIYGGAKLFERARGRTPSPTLRRGS